MPKTPNISTTRIQKRHFLVGQEQPDLGIEAKLGKLPKTRAVLQYLFHRKNLPKFKFQEVGLAICCPFQAGTLNPNCENNPDCQAPHECLVRKVKTDGNWLASGLPIVSDWSITKKIKRLNDDFRAIEKNRNNPKSDLEKRALFSKKLDSLFDISTADAEVTIKMDRLRSDEAILEDINFLSDQRDPKRRKMLVAERDLEYDETVGDKYLRDTSVEIGQSNQIFISKLVQV